MRVEAEAWIKWRNVSLVKVGTVEPPLKMEGGIAGQGAKPAVKNADREPALQGCDAGEPVSVEDSASQTFVARLRKIVSVFHNEPVAGVNRCFAIVLPRIIGVSSKPVVHVFTTE